MTALPTVEVGSAAAALVSDNQSIVWGTQVGTAIVFGAICAAVAHGRGRSWVAWFVLGFLFQCISLVILLVIPDLKVEESKHWQLSAETRRLREQLKKERQVADERHEAHNARLGAHDRALGMDTQQQAALPPPLPAITGATWFYAVGNERKGPVTRSELRDRWLDEEIPDTTLVWCEGMSDWRPIGDVAEILRGDGE